ncbi:LuxR C-terminal-related transcriptional regulator [Cellulomonas alba]|uniref:LuxR C-terminal-related transcriptional regulator n=1 Tax=Cellulomonas alba TaxID=3053467 RepID=A0ABT7SJD5_9CELL|nr:LuxR C-terminal-related transcriptional regulator [Cellulomonas alba]MDM7856296.1 LuxR C-terminal-related transcriptional regulator [Cellulomonas alba]
MSVEMDAENVRATADRAAGRGMLRARASIPRVPRTILRSELTARFEEAVAHRLTLVSAGPGWGKTTAAARWAQRRKDVAWLTLEARDDGASAFWQHVLTAMRVSGAVPAAHPLGDLRVPTRVTPAFLRRLYSAIEALPDPTVLVLDDAHLLTDDDVLSGLADLLRFPGPLRLVLATRADPVLPLHRLRAEGELAEIVAEDLAFRPVDVMAVAAAEGQTMTTADAGALVEETGGWPVGVRLRLTAAHEPAVDPQASASEYLLAEVLERQEHERRELLLRTSVTSAVCADLADALVPGGVSVAAFAGLVSNDFVTATGGAGWFRYHPLLRDMLRAQLRLEDPEAFREAHRSAARWMVHNGEPRQALEHAATAGDWDLFGEVFVDSAAGGLLGPDRESLAEALRAIPYADLPHTGTLELCAAADAVVSGRFEAARVHLAAARRLLGTTPRASASALLAVLVAMAARGTGDVGAVEAAGREAVDALERAPWRFPAFESYLVIALNNRDVGRLLVGDVAVAREALRDLVRASCDGPPSLALFNARAYLAFGDLVAGDIDVADASARDTLADAERWGWSASLQVRMAYAAAGMAGLLRGEDDEADRLVAQGLAADAGGAEPSSVLALRLLQTFVAVSRGRAHAAELALTAAEEVATALGGTPMLLRDLVVRALAEVQLLTRTARTWHGGRPASDDLAVAQVARARLLVAAGRAEAALPITRDVLRHGAGHADLVRVEALLAHASALARLSRPGVDDTLSQALDVAGPDRLVRPFVAARDEALDARLTRLVGTRHDPVARAVRARLQSGPTGPEPDPLVEPLTERELAMLSALPTMESNAEIAADFYVSVNTVKAHLKALYRKLGVASRREAVRRGRELGLLD